MKVEHVLIQDYIGDPSVSYENKLPAPQILLSTTKAGEADFTYSSALVTLLGCAYQQTVKVNNMAQFNISLHVYDCAKQKISKIHNRNIDLTRPSTESDEESVSFDFNNFFTSS